MYLDSAALSTRPSKVDHVGPNKIIVSDTTDRDRWPSSLRTFVCTQALRKGILQVLLGYLNPRREADLVPLGQHSLFGGEDAVRARFQGDQRR